MDTYQLSNDDPFITGPYNQLVSSEGGLNAQIDALSHMVEYIISDYQANHSPDRSYQLVRKLDDASKEIFANLNKNHLAADEAELLAKISKKVHDDAILQIIRDSNIHERLEDDIKFDFREIQVKTLPASSLLATPLNSSRRPINTRTPSMSVNPKRVYTEMYNEHLETINASKSEINIRHEIITLEENKQDQILGSSSPKKVPVLDEGCIKICNLFDEMKEEYDEHKLEAAYKYLQEIDALAANKNLDSKQSDYLNGLLAEYSNMIAQIRDDMRDMGRIVTELDDENGYELEKSKKNATIKYKNLPSGGVSLKLEALIDLPLFNLIALYYEPEGYARWTPFCKESKLVARLTRASNAMWMKWDLPPPVPMREALLTGSGFNRLDVNGTVILLAKTIHNDAELIQRLNLDNPCKPKITKMEIPYVGVELTPITANKTRMRLVTTFDPKISFVPLSLTAWIARKGSSYMLDTIIKRAANLTGPEWQKNFERSQDFYVWLRIVVDDFLRRNGKGGLDVDPNQEIKFDADQVNKLIAAKKMDSMQLK